MIKGHGNAGGRVMFVADSGSKEDKETGYALSGASERLLRQLGSPVNIRLDSCWRTLLYKDYLPGIGFSIRRDRQLIIEFLDSIKPISPESILLEEIRQIDPNLIIVMGNRSLQFLAGEKSISKFRGSILPTRSDLELPRAYKIIPTFSPKDIFETYPRFFITSADYENKIGKHARFSEIPPSQDVIWIARTYQEFNCFMKRHSNADFLTLDIETWHGIPTCISLCLDGKEAISIPFFDPKMSHADGVLLLQGIARLLQSDIPKVGQNINYDWTILARFGFVVNNIVGDTLLSAHTLYPEFEKNLGFLNSLYTSVPYFKDEGKESVSFPPDQQHLLYNAKDSLVTHKIHSAQQDELKELGLHDFYHKRVMPLFFTYKRMGDRGIRVSEEKRLKLRAKYQILLQMNQQELTQMVGYEFNPRSPDQVGKLVYEDLKYPKRVKTGKRGAEDAGKKSYNTDRKTLEELEVFHGDDNKFGIRGKTILAKIILARKLYKVLEYIETPIHSDGRWRASWNLAGAETGRTSSRKHIDSLLVESKGKWRFVKLGRSLQTITKHGFSLGADDEENEHSVDYAYTDLGKDLREMFVPSLGYEFVECDQSQAEARHVSVLAEDWETLRLLERTDFKKNKHGVKDDLHTLTASWVHGISWEDVTKEMRQKDGKPTRHGGNYDMTEIMFAFTYHVPIQWARRVLEIFHQKSPKIRAVFHTQIREALQKTRRLVNPYERARMFFGRLDRDTFKEGYAHIPQGTVSDHQKFAMVRAEPQVQEFANFLVESHDSTLAEVKIGYREQYAETMKRELIVPINYSRCTLSRDFNLVVPVEFKYSTESWSEDDMDDFYV